MTALQTGSFTVMFYYNVICTVCMHQMICYSPLHFHVYLITHVYGALGVYIHLQQLLSGSKMDFRLDEIILSLLKRFLEDQM